MAELEDFIQDYNLKLNDQQRAAVARVEGATLLLAVPGSGKTTVIICRIGYMIRALGIDPESILTLTFSRAGARDLGERYTKVFGPEDAGRLRFSTIHSFALSVIRNYERIYKREAFSILEHPGEIIREIYKELFKTWPSENDMADILSAITYCKNMMSTQEEIAAMQVAEVDFPRLFKAYEAYKRKQGLMDFDDMLKYAWIMLKKSPELLNLFKRQYAYINVDEAQDTSRIQFEILKLLVTGNIFVVGDEDQSIYGFRGAYPQGLLNFQKDYPEGQVLLMETNHRSTRKIVAAADRFIRLNRERYVKNMRTDNALGVEAVHEFVPTVEAQYAFIMASIQREAKETAVLYRNNESAIPLVDLFNREGIPYRLKEHSALFFTHFIVQDIRGFVALAKDPSDFETFEKIYYKMNCNISRKNVQDMAKIQRPGQSVFDALLSLSGLPNWLVEKVEDIQVSFKRLRTMGPLAGIEYIENHMGYAEHLVYRISCGHREETLMQKLDILKTLAAREESMEAFWRRLDSLRDSLAESHLGRPGGVTLSTIHSSKGLEFDKVFIIDAVDGEFPSKAALEDSDEGRRLFGEEVRLFYVGVTRARRELEFISVGKKNSKRNKRPVSRFVRYFLGEKLPEKKVEPPRKIEGRGAKRKPGGFDVAVLRQSAKATADCSAFEVGTRVIHKGFGPGVVIRVSGEAAVIDFEVSGPKKVNLPVCVANKLLAIAN
ncbi:MAG: ATP-dependent helicase [Eubacterium sp.]|nr:ATP-dependent helicase [Eubacterium sp.]